MAFNLSESEAQALKGSEQDRKDMARLGRKMLDAAQVSA
jgi:hypothetical protein